MNESPHDVMSKASQAIWLPPDGRKARQMFRYVNNENTNTVPGYASDVAATLLRVGYPRTELAQSLLEIAQRVIDYRRACLDVSEQLLKRLQQGRPIELTEIPSTNLGKFLWEIHQVLHEESSVAIEDACTYLSPAASDYEWDHEWDQRIANALTQSLSAKARTDRPAE